MIFHDRRKLRPTFAFFYCYTKDQFLVNKNSKYIAYSQIFLIDDNLKLNITFLNEGFSVHACMGGKQKCYTKNEKNLSSRYSKIVKKEENPLLLLGWRVYNLLIITLSRKQIILVLITQRSIMEFQRYIYLFYYFGIWKFQSSEKVDK